MTRSDIILAKVQAKSHDDKDELIDVLHHKIQEVYTIMFHLEKKGEKHPLYGLSQLLRKALES